MSTAKKELFNGTTESQLLEYTTEWKIQNASIILNPFKDVESSEFSSSDGFLKWRICLGQRDKVVFAFLKIECNHVDVDVHDLGRDAGNNIYLHYKIWSTQLYQNGNNPVIFEAKWNNFTEKSKTELHPINMHKLDFYRCLSVICKDTLILSCTIKLIKHVCNVDLTVNESSKFFCTDADMLRDGKYSDVVIEVDQHEIKAHKIILAFHSPVFRAMFDSDIQEAATNRVIIDDLDYDVVDEMLQFIYAGEAPNLEIMADRLLGAAAKYDLKALRALCEKTLCSNLKVDNAFKLMTLADLYDAKQLKSTVSIFLLIICRR